jgi:Flp pilus assembly secretin CpaC
MNKHSFRIAIGTILVGVTLGSVAHAQTATHKVPANAGNTAAAVAASTTYSPTRDAVIVMVDHAKIVRLPEKTQTVVVGNPIIADVTVQKNGILVVTGKSYGVTNLIALDNAGTMLAESMIRVQAASEAVVTIQRGLERESYSCTPNCQPSIQLGDANAYFGQVSGQASQRNSIAGGR